MRTKNISYWINQLGKSNTKAEPKDKNEDSYMQLAEFIVRENKKTAA